ncbi:MAG TPA: T9SS type A sorting domain-containing protein, partial [Bacteroidota bacterium]|nr:T9SS type A sorting domain-containing protein [Bacteroidota bacterium]
NYPNPFNPSTVIGYGLPSEGTVRLTVHDLLGRTVATIDEGFREPGVHSTAWTPIGLPTGIYYYRLVVSGSSGEGTVYSMSRKLMLLK